MIKYIKGYYAMTLSGGIVMETPSGIGFEINIPAGSPLYKYGEGEEITVFTAMIVKEDDISLYGFHNMESLDLFRMLITVSGIGAKGAMAIMGSISADELRRAILFEDVKEISKANGIGKKTAERLILELKDKIGKLAGASDTALSTAGMTETALAAEAGDARTEAICALVSLGYSKAEAFSAVAKVPEEGLTGEEYIKRALKSLF
ncbi:MAG: Holliday junction branch migration protein RuvA [Firmicutes bacterium]|nr:Holliday junction branch migration protein RuvA [Bacillota bacterium]